ncbi:MAG: GDSL-type esterase/lipase family protein [Perlucidibaca sp.]
MNRRPATGSAAKIIMLGAITLLLCYSTILTLHYKIPEKLLLRTHHGGQDPGITWLDSHEKDILFHEIRKQPDVIMLGDSITYGAQWSEYYPGITVFNRGIGGDTTAGVMARLDAIISEKPAEIFLMVGINDLLAGKDDDYIASNILQIARRIKGSGITPYVQSILYTERSYRYVTPTSAEINASVRAINARVQAQCQQEGIAFVDLNRPMADGEGFLRQGHTLDGLHPNARGYALWIAALRKLMPAP